MIYLEHKRVFGSGWTAIGSRIEFARDPKSLGLRASGRAAQIDFFDEIALRYLEIGRLGKSKVCKRVDVTPDGRQSSRAVAG